MDRKTRATGASVLIALGGLLAALMLVASPAGADGHGDGHHPTGHTSGDAVAVHDSTASGGCFAAHGSVCSGSGVAIDNSTSSGDATAVHGSVSSGCATAAHESTASGDSCEREKAKHKDKDGDVHKKGVVRTHRPGVGEGEEAPVATATGVTELAFTGSSTGPLAAAAFAALALGSLLVVLGSERRRPAHSS